jgi:hypothetical protein
MTDAQLAQLGLGDDLATAALAAVDAELVYGFVAQHPAASADDLAQFTVAQWGADAASTRRTHALAILALQARLACIQG